MTTKKRLVLLSACATLLCSGALVGCKRKNAEPANTPPFLNQTARRYGVKSGTVTYQISGSFLSGQETMQFDNYGEQEAKETHLIIELNGNRQEQRQRVILRDGVMYSIDMGTNRGTKMPDVISQHLLAAGSANDLAQIGPAVMQAMGGRKIGDDSVLGNDCDLWEIPNLGSTSCIVDGVPLSAEAKLGEATIRYEATAVSLDTPVAANAFDIPTGAVITDAPVPTNLNLPSS